MNNNRTNQSGLNPYETALDDARSRLRQTENKENLDLLDTLDLLGLPDSKESEYIPFPYGGRGYTPFKIN